MEPRTSPLRERVELLVYIFFWYAASVRGPAHRASACVRACALLRGQCFLADSPQSIQQSNIVTSKTATRPATLEATQGRILSQSPTDATSRRQHLNEI